MATLLAAHAPARSGYKQLLYQTHGALTATDRDRELDAFRHWRANDVPAALRTFLTKSREASCCPSAPPHHPTGRYADHVVLVTGGAQGLGLAMVQRFAAEGARVHFADVNATAGAEALERLEGSGHGFEQVDITDPAAARVGSTAWPRARAASTYCAGIIRDNRIENISAADWDAVLAVSLTGAFHCTQAAFAHIRERAYCRILSFSSMSWRGNFGQVNYVAAKAGVVGLTCRFALEARGAGSQPTPSRRDSWRPRCWPP